MTDQAEAPQSGAENAAPATFNEVDLAAILAGGKPESAQQPQGQAPAVEGEQNDEGEAPSESEQAVEEAPVEKFKVPALEGDGYEELTAEEIKAQRLMHQDYTRKTQKIAEERKAIEAERAKVNEVVTAKAQEIEQGLVMLGRAIQSFEQQVNWEALREVDPGAYLQAREQQAERVNAFKAAAQQLGTARREQAMQLQAINAQRLVEAIPTWLDKQTAQKEAGEIRKFAAEVYGYTDQDIDGITDFRQILALRDAMRFRQAQAKVAEVKPKLTEAPKLAQPGAAKPGNTQALDKYRTTQKAIKQPSKDNLAALLSKI